MSKFLYLRGLAAVGVVAGIAAGCSSGSQSGSATTPSTASTASTSTPNGGSGNTASAPGITPATVTVGNVSTVGGPVPGLFKGAQVGARAYFDYLNSQGGIYGRKLQLDTADDAFSGTQNKAQTIALLPHVFAFVGSFSLFDNEGGAAIPPTVANVSNSLNVSTVELPNTFSPAPTMPGYATGALLWFKQHYPTAVLHVGALVGDIPPVPTSWSFEQHAMETVGYKITTVENYSPAQASFTSDVISMQQAGVQMVVLDQADGASIARFLDAMQQQNFHPALVTSGGVAYTGNFIHQAGESAAEMVISDQRQALYLGTDASAVPEVATFDTWVQKSSPGFVPDIFTLFGWSSAMLFAQALKAAGQNPTQANLLAQLGKITYFDANGLQAPSDPANKGPQTAWLFARVVNGKWVRWNSPATGYLSGGTFVKFPGG